jgi:ribosomal-protein-alanine N-acetyltransferase
MLALETNRLILIPLTRNQLSAYLNTPELLEQELRVGLSRDIFTDRLRRAFSMKLEKMSAAPQEMHAWLTYWLIVVRDANFGAGLIGYKGFPDENGVVYNGYGIDPAYQKHGYTSEAVRAMDAWAFKEEACQCVVAYIALDNLASQHVVAKCGYIRQSYLHQGEQVWRLEKGSTQ